MGRLPLGLAFPDDRSLVFGYGRRYRLAGQLLHRGEAGGTYLEAGSAVGAFVLIDDVDLLLGAVDGVFRTGPQADQAGLAFVRIDPVRDERLAGQNGAALLLDVRLVLLAEVLDRAQEGVGGTLTQSAQRSLDGRLRQVDRDLGLLV